ncbi:MAG: isochorismatase family cysteine hydrolase [Steroidobacteraceae bacterium]
MSTTSPTYIDDYTRPVNLSRDTTALVIVDMQNASGSRAHGLGKLLASQGKLADAEYRFARIENVIIPNIARLAASFRKAGVRLIYVTYGSNLRDFSDAPVHLKDWLVATNNRAGEAEHEIVPALAPQPGELVLNKTTMGAFGSTAIDAHLKSMGISEIVVVGVSTNNCVGMTAMEAADRQYGVVIVSDATGTCSDEMQDAYLRTFRRLWGRVASTDEVIAEVT